jgi:hypothetical protein
LTSAWFAGWLAAACQQDPRLAAATGSYYAPKRLADAAAGRLRVLVDHRYLLLRRAGPAAGTSVARCRQAAAVRTAGGVLDG